MVIRRMIGRERAIVVAMAAWSLVVLGASCSTGDAADRDRRTSDVYVAVLGAALDAEPAQPDGEEDDGAGSASSTSTSGAAPATASSSTTSTTTGGSTPTTGASGSTTSGPSTTATGKGSRDGRKEKELPLMFVAPLEEGRPFSLEVQAAVIEQLGKRATVRFVDTRQQAVDAKLEDEPALDGGVLLRLGRVPAGGDEVQVAAERYQRADDWVAMRFVVRAEDAVWTATLIDRQPRPADADD